MSVHFFINTESEKKHHTESFTTQTGNKKKAITTTVNFNITKDITVREAIGLILLRFNQKFHETGYQLRFEDNPDLFRLQPGGQVSETENTNQFSNPNQPSNLFYNLLINPYKVKFFKSKILIK